MKPSDNTRQLETWKLTYLVLDADRSVEGTRTTKFRRYSKRC